MPWMTKISSVCCLSINIGSVSMRKWWETDCIYGDMSRMSSEHWDRTWSSPKAVSSLSLMVWALPGCQESEKAGLGLSQDGRVPWLPGYGAPRIWFEGLLGRRSLCQVDVAANRETLPLWKHRVAQLCACFHLSSASEPWSSWDGARVPTRSQGSI